MNELLSLWSGFVATWFVHGTALLIVAALLDRKLGRNEAAREAVWRVALLGGLVAALVAVARVESADDAELGADESVAEASAALDLETLQNRFESIETTVDELEGNEDETALAVGWGGVDWGRHGFESVQVPSWLGTAALVLSALGLLRLAGRRLALGRRLADRPNRNDRLHSELGEVSRSLGLRRVPGLRVTDHARSPLVLGVLRSRVLWPSCAEGRLGEGARRAALAHELAHVRRRDPLWLATALFVEAMFPWHPLVRHARLRMLETAELRADELAARSTDATEVADGLVEVAAFGVVDRRVPACGMSVRASGLRQRVERLLESSSDSTVGKLWGSACLAMTCCALVAATSLPAFGGEEDLAEDRAEVRVLASTLQDDLASLGRDRRAFEARLTQLRSLMERQQLEDEDLALLTELDRRLDRFDERRVRLAARVSLLLAGLADPTTGEMIR